MELSEELERRVDERTAELLHMSEELDSFAYVFSHDLQGPIRAVSLNAGFVRTDLGTLLTPEIRGSLDRIEQSAIHTSQLIDGLLTLSRITRSDLEVRDVDLSSIVSEIVDQNVGRSVGRAFDIRIAEGIIARADPMLAQKLLEHLIGNAFKFTGGCELARIEFGAVRDAGENRYFVRDNGAGFEEAFASRLFTPFERLHDAGDFPGWGIGLATAKRIVNRHGGRIWAAADPGVGATFYFTLEA
jgi:light-regulated signal transduction histidine kinase (bacteriophytochrome)